MATLLATIKQVWKDAGSTSVQEIKTYVLYSASTTTSGVCSSTKQVSINLSHKTGKYQI